MMLAFNLGDLVTVPFGYLLSFLYDVTTNYGVALILFAVIVRFILLPATAMLQLPGITLFSHFWNVHFFSTGSITFLALGAICCFPDRLKLLCRTLPRWLVGAFGILFAISLWQIFRHWNNYLLADMGFTLLYPVLPLFGLVFRKELVKYLPLQLTVFWSLNIIANLIQIYYFRSFYYGIPSNVNWNAAFVLFSGTGTVFWIWNTLKKN